MRDVLPISCFIIAKNEADRIGATIDSVKGWVAEILVIDSGSEDATVEVAKRHGAQVMYHAWPGYGPQKRYGEEQCSQPWLLNLDADEVVTPELADEIAALFHGGEPKITGYFLKVRDLLPGETKLAPFAHTNRCLRLYDKRKARFSDSPVHDSVIVEEGETQHLQHPVLHYSFRSLTHMLEKINAYSTAQANDMIARGKRVSKIRLLTELKISFFKIYFMRGYALRGWKGFTYSLVFAYGRFLRIAKYFELR